MKFCVTFVLLCLVGSSVCAPERRFSESRGSRTHNKLLSSRSGTLSTNNSSTNFSNNKSSQTKNRMSGAQDSVGASATRTYKVAQGKSTSYHRTGKSGKRGISHYDSKLPLGPRSGLSTSTEPPALSTLSPDATSTSVAAVTSSASLTRTALPPTQSHPEKAKSISKRNPTFVKKNAKRDDSSSTSLNMAPTPAPTGPNSANTTVHISSETDFALLLPSQQGGTHSLSVSINP